MNDLGFPEREIDSALQSHIPRVPPVAPAEITIGEAEEADEGPATASSWRTDPLDTSNIGMQEEDAEATPEAVEAAPAAGALTVKETVEEDDAWDDPIPDDAYPAWKSAPGNAPTPKGLYYQVHPVGRYIAHPPVGLLEAGSVVKIPTGWTERTTYTKLSNEWATNQTAGEYRDELFADERPDANPETASIAGGEAEAFAPGKVVVDIASGEALGLLQLADQHPGTICIGVDTNYAEEREPDLTRTGVQLTRGDWHDLSQLPDSCTDTILSLRGIGRWGISVHNPRSPEIADTLTRIAREGGTFRFDPSNNPEDRELAFTLLRERGWDIYEVRDLYDRLLPTAVAIRRRT